MNSFLKIFAALILIIGITFHHIQAQSVGLKSGVNVSNFYNADFDSDNRVAFNIGLYGNFNLKQIPFSIQPELYYSQKGSVSSWQSGDIVVNGRFKIEYIEAPILVKFSNNLTSYTNLNIMAGPSFAYLLRSNFSSTDIKDTTRSTDIGLVGSVGFDFPLASRLMSFEVRYNRGFSKIFESGINPECCGEFDRPQKNQTISIILGVEL
jgi:hypothetical protein